MLRLDWQPLKAYVREVNATYYTEAISQLKVRVVEPIVSDPPRARGLGYAHVVRAVPGFKKLRFRTHENVGFGPVHLPDLELHTIAAHWTMDGPVLATLPDPGRRAAAALAIGRGIYAVLEKQKAALDKARDEYREMLWANFPDLQTADSTTDAGQVQYGVRPILTSNDWTKLVLPRFRGEWVGVERKKGFAFAPGKTTKWSNTFGEDVQAFEPSGGLGLIPGTNVLTSVIQVSLDPRGQAMQSFLKTGYYDPRVQGPPTLLRSGAQYVIDTGTFYEATRNLCILAWEQAQVRGSPFMYRFDVKLMDERWRDAGAHHHRARTTRQNSALAT